MPFLLTSSSRAKHLFLIRKRQVTCFSEKNHARWRVESRFLSQRSFILIAMFTKGMPPTCNFYLTHKKHNPLMLFVMNLRLRDLHVNHNWQWFGSLSQLAIAPVFLRAGRHKTKSTDFTHCNRRIPQAITAQGIFYWLAFSTILPIFLPPPEERSRRWLVSKMVRLIGTGLLAMGVVVVLANPMLVQIWVAAIALGLLSHWVAQNWQCVLENRSRWRTDRWKLMTESWWLKADDQKLNAPRFL